MRAQNEENTRGDDPDPSDGPVLAPGVSRPLRFRRSPWPFTSAESTPNTAADYQRAASRYSHPDSWRGRPVPRWASPWSRARAWTNRRQAIGGLIPRGTCRRCSSKLRQIRGAGFERCRGRTAALAVFAVTNGAVALIQIRALGQTGVVGAGDFQLRFGWRGR